MDEGTTAAAQPVIDVVSVNDFAAVDWAGPAAALAKVNTHDLGALYLGLAKAAEERGDGRALRVHRLLFAVCDMVMRYKDRAQPYWPRLDIEGMPRSAVPEDLRGEQNEALVLIAPLAENPGLRARLADVAWTADRRSKASADLAIDAYCECVEGLIDGRYEGMLAGRGASFEQVAFAVRALQITYATTNGRAAPERVARAVKAVYDLALAAQEQVVFIDIAGFAVLHGVVDATVAAADAEAIALQDAPEGRSHAVQGLWLFAAGTWQRTGDGEGERRCLLKSIDMTLDRARKAPSPFVASHFLREAINALRPIKGTQAMREDLKRELRDRQAEAAGEMPQGGQKIDVRELVATNRARFADLDLPQALLAFSQLCPPTRPAVLEREVMENRRRSPFSNLFGTVHQESDGKVVAQAPHGGDDDAVDPAWLKEAIGRLARSMRHMDARAEIDPVRAQLHDRFEIAERHLWPIVTASCACAPEHQPLLILGFTRFFQGDMMSAAHLLLPQMEAMVRHILLTAGHDPTIIKADMIQEDRTLSSILEGMRGELEAILGPATVLAIDLIFNHRPPGLRHVIAHGKLSAAECFSSDVIYACWFLFHLTAMPLWDAWDSLVAGDIAAAA